MDERGRRGAESLLAAMRFQERVLSTLRVSLDQLSANEQALLDVCMQAHLDAMREARRGAPWRPGDLAALRDQAARERDEP